MFANSTLSMDQAPPFNAPVRFFVTAPIFAALAGLVLFFGDSSSFISRYSPQLIAVVHLITLGFFAQVMLGALQQMLPVLAGVKIPKPIVVASLVHTFLLVGTFSFFIGLFYQITFLITLSAYLLGFAFLLFLSIISFLLVKGDYKNYTINAMRSALFSAIMVVVLGILLLKGYSGSFLENHTQLADLHIYWAIFGFVSLLVFGVAYQVIPMFYVTPQYHITTKKSFLLLFLTLIVVSILVVLDIYSDLISLIFKLIFLVIFTHFAISTIKLLNKRRRPISDTTVFYWRVSMFSLVTAIFLFFINHFFQNETIAILVGVIFGVGFGISLLFGMLYKIVPFLAWFHLSGSGRFDIPTIREFIPEKLAKPQFYLHVISFAIFIASALTPAMIPFAGLLFFVSNMFILINILLAIKLYIKYTNMPKVF